MYNQISATLDQLFLRMASTNNNDRLAAEHELKVLKQSPRYPLDLLLYMQQTNSLENLLRASIQVKLWFSNYKTLQQFQTEHLLTIVDEAKPIIVVLYLTGHDKIASQLCQAIVFMTEREFPDRWENLPTELIHKVTENTNNTLRVLKLLKKITDKYSYLLRSDPLYKEIIMVCNLVHDFLLNATESVLEYLIANPDAGPFYKILKYLLKLFYNLNYQDLHPKFQDNLVKWMQILVHVMRINHTSEETFKCKGQALRSILLYASKYRDDVQSCIEEFSQQIWKLCSKTDQNSQFDKIVLNALKYFKHLVMWPDMKQFFSGNLSTLLSTLILPNIGATKNVEQIFEEEPMLFIDIYFQNSDLNSRRSGSIDLLKSIARHYNLDEYLIQYIEQYRSATSRVLQNQSLLLNLVIDSATVAYRSTDGVTQLAIKKQIIEGIYLNIVKPNFSLVYQWIIGNQNKQIENEYNLLNLALQLRFVYFFRLYLPQQDLPLMVQFCASLTTNSKTFKNIIYITLEAFLQIKHGNYSLYKDFISYFDQNRLDPLAYDVLKTLYINEAKETELNMHLTKTLYILCKNLKQKSTNYTEAFTTIINSMLTKTDSFEFKCAVFLFETLSQLIYWNLHQNKSISAIENSIQPYFKKLMNQGSDLLNFSFQIYALIVHLRKEISQVYKTMYRSLLGANNWVTTNQSLFSAYIMYLAAYLGRVPENLANDKAAIEMILAKLVSSNHYIHFVDLINQIYLILGLEGFYNSGYMQLMIQGLGALSSNEDNKMQVLRQGLVFFSNLLSRNNTTVVLNYVNNISINFVQTLFLESLPIIASIQMREDRRIIFFTISNFLANNLLSSIDKWGILLNALVQNTTRKFTRGAVSAMIPANAASDSTFQKLNLWSKIKPSLEPLVTDQEQYMVKIFNTVYPQLQNSMNIANFLSEQSQLQLTKLIKRYANN